MLLVAALLIAALVLASGVCMAAPPSVVGVVRTYEYQIDGTIVRQKVTCQPPTQREDGSALDWATEGKEFVWRLLLNAGGSWQNLVQYGRTTACEFWTPIYPDMPNYNLAATAVDLQGLESQPSAALRMRYVPVP